MTFDDLTRRNIRYICFRLQTEALGGALAKKEKADIMQFVDKIKEHMEEQEDFGGWAKFAKTWDVDNISPLVVVKRTSSIQTEWNRILKEETKVLPAIVKQKTEEKKFLTNKLAQTVAERKNANDLARKSGRKKSFWDNLR